MVAAQDIQVNDYVISNSLLLLFLLSGSGQTAADDPSGVALPSSSSSANRFYASSDIPDESQQQLLADYHYEQQNQHQQHPVYLNQPCISQNNLPYDPTVDTPGAIGGVIEASAEGGAACANPSAMGGENNVNVGLPDSASKVHFYTASIQGEKDDISLYGTPKEEMAPPTASQCSSR